MCDDTVMNVGNTAKARKNFDDPQEGRVYHPKGVAPTIRSRWETERLRTR